MIDGETVLRAVKGVIEGSLGTLRTTQGYRFSFRPGLFEDGIDPDKTLLVEDEHIYDFRHAAVDEHASSNVSALSNRSIDATLFTVLVVTSKQPQEDDIAFRGRVLTVQSVLRDALGNPGNLDIDDRGKATGIASGCLCSPSFRARPVGTTPQYDCDLAVWTVEGVAIFETSHQ